MEGRVNVAFGIIYLIFTVALGLYLADREVFNALEGARGQLLSSALVSSTTDAILNVIIGYLILRLPLVSWFSKLLSSITLCGTILHSGVLYVSGAGLVPAATVFAPLGGVFMVIVAFFMGVGVIGLKAAR